MKLYFFLQIGKFSRDLKFFWKFEIFQEISIIILFYEFSNPLKKKAKEGSGFNIFPIFQIFRHFLRFGYLKYFGRKKMKKVRISGRG